MIEDSEHNTERALAKLFYDLISKVDVVVVTHGVLLLVSIEAMIGGLINAAPLGTPCQGGLFALPFQTLLVIEVIDCGIILNFFLFIFS